MSGRAVRLVDGVKVATVESPIRAIEDLLIFDARALDKPTQQDLLRIVPELIHIRRAWRAHYVAKGCLSCRKGTDPTVAIAARLRRRGLTWKEIYEIVGTKAANRVQRQRFENAVRWKLEHLNSRERKPSFRYGAGGFCDRCYVRILNAMRRRYRKLTAGRDFTADLEAFTEALTLKFNHAQRLLNGPDIANIPNQRRAEIDCNPRRRLDVELEFEGPPQRRITEKCQRSKTN